MSDEQRSGRNLGDLGLMRERFKFVAADRRWWGEWGEADEREFAAAIREAVESGDAERIEDWARWLEAASEQVERMQADRAAAQAQIEARIEEQRRRAE